MEAQPYLLEDESHWFICVKQASAPFTKFDVWLKKKPKIKVDLEKKTWINIGQYGLFLQYLY